MNKINTALHSYTNILFHNKNIYRILERLEGGKGERKKCYNYSLIKNLLKKKNSLTPVQLSLGSRAWCFPWEHKHGGGNRKLWAVPQEQGRGEHVGMFASRSFLPRSAPSDSRTCLICMHWASTSSASKFTSSYTPHQLLTQMHLLDITLSVQHQGMSLWIRLLLHRRNNLHLGMKTKILNSYVRFYIFFSALDGILEHCWV